MSASSSAEGLRDELDRIQKTRRCSKERAFLIWYLAHSFEKDARSKITDGKNDGCIDALVELKKGRRLEYAVVQAKYTDSVFRGHPSPLPVSFYLEFDALPETFGNRGKFEEYLESVDSSLRSAYRELAQHLQEGHEVNWYLTTLHGRSRAGENRLRNLDSSQFLYAADNLFLYDLSLEGAEPPAEPMQLRFSELFISDDPQRHVKSYVLRARLMDFLYYVEKDQKLRVLARNVRSDLKSKVNETIRDTYETNPEEFWYSHNGITIICKEATVRGKSMNLRAPSIINGAQTIHSLKNSSLRDPRAQVLVRVIEIPWKEEQKAKAQARSMINAIIFRTNQQNRMYMYDLRSNDPLQVSLAREFLARKIFYERKRGEWNLNKRFLKNQGLTRLTLKQLAQILCACDPRAGGVPVAKRTIEKLFADKRYEYIFEPDFPEVFLKLKLHDFLEECLYYRYRYQSWTEIKQELLTSFSLFWHCIESTKGLRDWEQRLLGSPSMLSVVNPDCKALVHRARETFRACWGLWKLERRKDKSLTPKNFFRSEEWNVKILRRYVPRFRRSIVSAFSEAFAYVD